MLNEHCSGLQVVVLEVYFENEDEAHLRLGRDSLDDFVHQHVLLRFLLLLSLILLGWLVEALALDDHLHLDIVDAELGIGVHEGEEHSEVLASADFSKRRIVVECSVCLHSVVAHIV